jgi:hypothetical protein
MMRAVWAGLGVYYAPLLVVRAGLDGLSPAKTPDS